MHAKPEGDGVVSEDQEALAQVRAALAEDRLNDAVEMAERVLTRAAGQREVMADAAYLASMAAYRLGRWHVLRDLAQQALPLLEQLGQIERQIEVSRWLTLGAVETGRFDLALRCAHDAYRLAQSTGNAASIGLSLVALGSCIERLGDAWQAQRLMEEARAAVQGVEDAYTHCVILNNLCASCIGIYYLLRNTAETEELARVMASAEQHAREALVWMERFPRNDFVASIVEGNLGETLVHCGKFDDARRFLDSALARVSKANNLARGWRIRYSMAELDLARGDPRQARDALRVLVAEMAGSEQLNTLMRVQDSLYRACRALSDELGALQALEAYVALERKRVIAQLRGQSQLFVTRLEAETARRELLAERSRAAQLEVDVHRDALTGVYNRRYLETHGRAMVEACAAEGRPIAVAMVDLDHFKDVNDTLGHQTGDRVLRQMAKLLASGLRGTDRILRYGGEEFVILLPDAQLASAREVCERLRAAVETQDWQELGGALKPTISIGLAVSPPHHLETLIAAADRALYEAKGAGRNRVAS